MDSYILCGMQFGNEGKGTFVDYLAHEKSIDCIVRYNGGSQASHTVITPANILHKFSQLGSGMFLDKCHTYITENMVINIDNLMIELEVFSKKTGISISELLERIHIHRECFVVTPYHKLINKLRELSKGKNRRGTVGTCVSEVKYLLAEHKNLKFPATLGLQVKDIFNSFSNNPIISRMAALQSYVNNFYKKNKEIIWQNAPEEIKEPLKKEIDFLLGDYAFFKIASDYVTRFKNQPRETSLKKCLYSSYESSIWKNNKNAIFEGSQGLLIDCNYGIKPNTTSLDTTNHFAFSLSYLEDNVTSIGIAKAFNSRHGLGVFPTETTEVSRRICDNNQDESFWNGKIRFGWFDAVLLRYAQGINYVSELYLSSVDKLDSFETIKICNEYYYNGIVDENFKKLFWYNTLENGQIVITDILDCDEDLGMGKYLEQCIPKYIEIKGWQCDISKVTDRASLPKECLEYIALLEKLIQIPITVISVGPTRENKIRMR